MDTMSVLLAKAQEEGEKSAASVKAEVISKPETKTTQTGSKSAFH